MIAQTKKLASFVLMVDFYIPSHIPLCGSDLLYILFVSIETDYRIA